MIIYYALAIVTIIFGWIIKPQKNKKRKKKFVIIIFGLLCLVAALRSNVVGIDLSVHYASGFEKISQFSWSKIPLYSVLTTYEMGYCYFCKLISLFSTNVQCLIIVSSIISIGTMGYFLYELSEDIVLSTELFILSCTYFMYMNIIRQAMAISIILVAYVLYTKRREKLLGKILFVLLVLLAATFHTSAILCLVMLLFDYLQFKRSHLIFGGIAVTIAFFLYAEIYDLMLKLFGIGAHYAKYVNHSIEGTGSLNTQSIIIVFLTLGAFVLGYYELVWKRKKRQVDTRVMYFLKKEESFELYMAALAVACRLLIFQMNIINRFTYFFMPFIFLLYPRAVESITYKSNKKIVRGLIYFLFMTYYIWMIINYASSFYGTVPYIPFWK